MVEGVLIAWSGAKRGVEQGGVGGSRSWVVRSRWAVRSPDCRGVLRGGGRQGAHKGPGEIGQVTVGEVPLCQFRVAVEKREVCWEGRGGESVARGDIWV